MNKAIGTLLLPEAGSAALPVTALIAVNLWAVATSSLKW